MVGVMGLPEAHIIQTISKALVAILAAQLRIARDGLAVIIVAQGSTIADDIPAGKEIILPDIDLDRACSRFERINEIFKPRLVISIVNANAGLIGPFRIC